MCACVRACVRLCVSWGEKPQILAHEMLFIQNCSSVTIPSPQLSTAYCRNNNNSKHFAVLLNINEKKIKCHTQQLSTRRSSVTLFLTVFSFSPGQVNTSFLSSLAFTHDRRASGRALQVIGPASTLSDCVHAPPRTRASLCDLFARTASTFSTLCVCN